MKKVMFDTNVFDKIRNDYKLLEKSADTKYEYLITNIQIEELCEISQDKTEIMKQNFFALISIRAKLVPTAVLVFGETRWGMARWGKGEVYNKIVNKNKSNARDAIIAETAVYESCTLITEDRKWL